jgi:magnesium transporter
MPKTVTRRSKKHGLSPGTLMHIGTQTPGKTSINLIEYDADLLKERQISSLDECSIRTPPPTITWVNVEGLSQLEVMQHFGSCYGIHPLVLEDILTTDQRPKAEDFTDYLYLVLKMLSLDKGSGAIKKEQVSIILGEHFVISFQEGLDGDVFGPVRERLNNQQGRLRTSGADFLVHALLDIIVDNYFLVLEKLGERIEEIEEDLVDNPTTMTMHAIYGLKREMLFLHKAIWPLREVVGSLQRRDSKLITDATVIYLRDLYDHTIQVVDTLETLRDMLSGMLDIYLSSVSNRLNAVMKVLTIIATIFMPLTFLAGVYGMNFKHMPELEWRWGYPALWLLMLGIAVAMMFFFRKKKWL